MCRAERTDNMVRGKLGDHSVGDGQAKKPKHTKRARAPTNDHSVGDGCAKKPKHTKPARAPTNKCVHGNWPSLCLKGCGGNSVCVHGSTNSRCLKGCGGNLVCVHGSLKTFCVQGCGGNSEFGKGPPSKKQKIPSSPGGGHGKPFYVCTLPLALPFCSPSFFPTISLTPPRVR